jgi:hypothetical protein
MTYAPREPASSPKLNAWHLDRVAIVYVRQSTPQQVLDHRESTTRQYALDERAVALGWHGSQVLVIDDDLGKSGQSIEGRPGFQRLLAEIALDRVGLILGLEVSRRPARARIGITSSSSMPGSASCWPTPTGYTTRPSTSIASCSG